MVDEEEIHRNKLANKTYISPAEIVNAIPILTNAVASSRNSFSESHFADDAQKWLALFARDMTNSIGQLLLHFI